MTLAYISVTRQCAYWCWKFQAQFNSGIKVCWKTSIRLRCEFSTRSWQQLLVTPLVIDHRLWCHVKPRPLLITFITASSEKLQHWHGGEHLRQCVSPHAIDLNEHSSEVRSCVLLQLTQCACCCKACQHRKKHARLRETVLDFPFEVFRILPTIASIPPGFPALISLGPIPGLLSPFPIILILKRCNLQLPIGCWVLAMKLSSWPGQMWKLSRANWRYAYLTATEH